MIRRPPRSTQSRSSAASDVYKRQSLDSDLGPVRAGVGDQFIDGGSDWGLVDLTAWRKVCGLTEHHAVVCCKQGGSVVRVIETIFGKSGEAVPFPLVYPAPGWVPGGHVEVCLLYTSDAADDLLCVDLGGRRIIKKKTADRITSA